MNIKQWSVFGFGFLILGVTFILLDLFYSKLCNFNIDCIGGVIFEPFIYISFILSILFFINVWLEKNE